LHYLRTQRPRFLFLGLGETDEYGHKNDYRGYLRALSHADYVVGQIAAILSAYERQGRRTTLIVTTDHGRSDDFIAHGDFAPESAQIWLIAAGWGIRPQGVVVPSEPRYLGDIAATIRTIGGLTREEPSSAPLAEVLYPAAVEVALAE
jgi:phosphopentomutase